MLDLEVNDALVLDDLQQFAVLAERELSDVIEAQAKGFTRRIIQMTPPQGGKVKGVAAKKALESRILVDMWGIFRTMQIKGRRRRKFPDPGPILHRQRMHRRGNSMRRAPRERVPVEMRDLKRLHNDLKKRIGRLGAGWNSAAMRLGVKAPAWIKRHGMGEGGSVIQLRGVRPRIEVWNAVPYGNAAHLERLSDAAVVYQQNALNRQLQHVLRKSLRSSRLS